MPSTQDLCTSSLSTLASSTLTSSTPAPSTLVSSTVPVWEHLLMQPGGLQSDLLEHQLKQLFRDAGIPVMPSQLITSTQDLKQIGLDYPIRLKSQVHSGALSAAGGVEIVTNTIDAISASHRLFDTQINDEYPEYLLAESLCKPSLYVGLGMEVNPETRQIVLQGWRLDGSEATSRPCHLCLERFSSDAAQDLGAQLGLSGPSLTTVVRILEKMSVLMEWLSIRSLVIDPLALDEEGEAIAVDGKIRFTAAALESQPQLKKLFSPKPEVAPPVVQLEGNIGILSNGMGLAMTTVDSLKQAGGEAAAFVSVKEQQGAVARQVSKAKLRRTQERMALGLENLARLKDVKLILVNWSGLASSCRDVAETIVNYFHMTGQHRHLRGTKLPVPLVVHLTGPEAELGRTLLQEVGITAVDSLEEAIAEGIGLARMRSAA